MKYLIHLSLILFTFSNLSHAGTDSQDRTQAIADDQRIVMIGASYLRGWPLKSVDCIPVENLGISGETTSQVRERFEKDALEKKPVAIILWGHINDFSNAPMEQEQQTRQTAIDNLKFMLDRTLEQGIIPVIATEITFGRPSDIKSSFMRFVANLMGKRGFQDYISTNVMAVNEWIRDYAKTHDIAVLEIEKLMTNAEGYRKEGYYTEDFSHITEQAYQDLQAFSQPFLLQALIDKHKLCK